MADDGCGDEAKRDRQSTRAPRNRSSAGAAVALESLQPLVSRLTEMQGLGGFVKATVEEVASSLHAIGAVVGLVREDKLVLEAVFGYQHRAACSFSEVSLDFALPMTEAVSTREPIWTRSQQELRREYRAVRGLDQRTNAFAALPLMIGGQAVGAFGVSFATPRRFVSDERRYLLMLADLCAFYLSRTSDEPTESDVSAPVASISRTPSASMPCTDDLTLRVALLEDKVAQQARLLSFLGELLTHQSGAD